MRAIRCSLICLASLVAAAGCSKDDEALKVAGELKSFDEDVTATVGLQGDAAKLKELEALIGKQAPLFHARINALRIEKLGDPAVKALDDACAKNMDAAKNLHASSFSFKGGSDVSFRAYELAEGLCRICQTGDDDPHVKCEDLH